MKKVDFQEWCFCNETGNTIDTMYDIRTPFVINGYEYATDGRVILRRKTRGKNTVGRRLPPLNCTNYLTDLAMAATSTNPWPIIDESVSRVPCFRCGLARPVNLRFTFQSGCFVNMDGRLVERIGELGGVFYYYRPIQNGCAIAFRADGGIAGLVMGLVDVD